MRLERRNFVVLFGPLGSGRHDLAGLVQAGVQFLSFDITSGRAIKPIHVSDDPASGLPQVDSPDELPEHQTRTVLLSIEEYINDPVWGNAESDYAGWEQRVCSSLSRRASLALRSGIGCVVLSVYFGADHPMVTELIELAVQERYTLYAFTSLDQREGNARAREKAARRPLEPSSAHWQAGRLPASLDLAREQELDPEPLAVRLQPDLSQAEAETAQVWMTVPGDAWDELSVGTTFLMKTGAAPEISNARRLAMRVQEGENLTLSIGVSIAEVDALAQRLGLLVPTGWTWAESE